MRALDVLGRVEPDDAHDVAHAGLLARQRGAARAACAFGSSGSMNSSAGVVARLCDVRIVDATSRRPTPLSRAAGRGRRSRRSGRGRRPRCRGTPAVLVVVGQQAVRALDVLGRVEADDAHHVAHAGLLAAEREAGAQLGALLVVRVHEQLGGVVARLAVDLDLPAEVRGVGVVEPVVVGEPGVALGEDDELAGALVGQAGRGQRLALEDLADAVERGDRLARAREVGRVRRRRRGRSGGRRPRTRARSTGRGTPCPACV